MRKRELDRSRRDKGSAVLLAACTFLFIGLAGLVVDYGLVAKTKADLTAALDAAVLAGAPELPSTVPAETICRQFSGTIVPSWQFHSAKRDLLESLA